MMIANEAVDKYLFLLLILQKEYLLILQIPASITRSIHWVLTCGIDAPWKMTCLSRSLSLANSGMESPILGALGNGWSLVQSPSHSPTPAILDSIHPSMGKCLLNTHSCWSISNSHIEGRSWRTWESGKLMYISASEGVIWLGLKLTDGKGHPCADLPPLCPTPWKLVTSRVLCTKSKFLAFHWKGVLALFSNYSEGVHYFLIKWKVTWRQNCVIQFPAKYHALPINTYAYSFLFVSDPKKSKTVFQT